MEIEKIVVGAFEVNCYVLWEEGREAVVVDPGADGGKITAVLREKDLQVAAYILTRGHMDHISALADLHAEMQAPIRMHAADLAWAFTEANQVPPYYPVPRKPDGEFVELADGEKVDFLGGFKVIATPGHTPGGVCIHFPQAKILFSGDTLFKGSVGRTDYPGGDSRQLAQSLKKLKQLPDDTTVYPGHGPETTIGFEKEHNIFLR